MVFKGFTGSPRGPVSLITNGVEVQRRKIHYSIRMLLELVRTDDIIINNIYK